jgi:poly(A) polymerase
MNHKEVIARKIIKNLLDKGFHAVFAGGSVRDTVRGVEAKDYDIATNATPQEIIKIFDKTIEVGVQFGVVLVVEENIPFEVATFRKDLNYKDGRHPESVQFTSLEEDAKRRDFTINGLFFDTEKNAVIDFVGGKEDIQKKIIKTIGEPSQRFLEDHLRMMRAIRFSVQLGFEIEKNTFAAISKHADLIQKVSAERIRDELTKILTSKNPAEGIRLLDQVGLLKHILPEVILLKGVEQPMEYHPEGDVFIHTMMLLEGLKENAPIELAMGALLHDIAKPQTFERAVDRIRFHGHDVLGAEMSYEICKRLHYSNEQTELICSLVREHLRFKDAFNMRLSTLKRFLSLDRFDLHLQLHWLDCMASHKKLEAFHFCTEKYEEFKKLPPPPLRLINGQDLIALGLKPGPDFTKILRTVEDAILEGTVQTREQALELVKTHYAK